MPRSKRRSARGSSHNQRLLVGGRRGGAQSGEETGRTARAALRTSPSLEPWPSPRSSAQRSGRSLWPGPQRVDTSQERMFTMARSRRKFTPEYEDEAVKLVLTAGRAVATVARELAPHL